MRSNSTRHIPYILTVLGAMFVSSTVNAYPLVGKHWDRTQPDGSVVEVVLWGDEFYARAESLDGYTLVVDPVTQFLCYAVPGTDQTLQSSGIVYDGRIDPSVLAAAGITKGLDTGVEQRAAIATEKRTRLGIDWGVIQSRQAQTGSSTSSVIVPVGEPAPTGTITGIVVLVDFPDRAGTIGVSEVDNAFNSLSPYGGTWHGSIRNWSEQISGGITSVRHQIVGYYRAQHDVAFYNAPTAEWDYSTSDDLYKEIYAYLDANVDLSSIAVNGRLQSLAVVYAGNIIARDWAMALWPHGGCGGTGYRTSEGVRIDRCFLTNLGTRVPLADLETFRHELGHSVFSWPDTYDYDSDSQSGGGYATETDVPCAPFRMWAGWLTPINVTSQTGVFSLDANGAAVLRYNNAANSREYFIAEYAKKDARRSPPDEGLLIWHIDERGDNSWQDMTASRHYAMSVEQADGRFDLEKNVRAGAGDLFHNGDKDKFDDTTVPDSDWWNGSVSGFKLCNIGPTTGTTMNVNVGCVAAGGTASMGGASSVGGSTSLGGTTARGGSTSLGGTTARGGSTSLGGTTARGGSTSRGGTTSLGGTTARGGATAVAAGGSLLGLGGASLVSSAGGSLTTTGTLATLGGALATGGAATTGTQGLGGAAAGLGGGSIGSPTANVGGAMGAVGGALTTATSLPQVASDAGGEDGGCGCRVAGQADRSSRFTGLLSVCAFALLSRRRRSRKS